MYLFLAVMSLYCWEGFSLVVASGNYSLVGLCKLIVVVSLVFLFALDFLICEKWVKNTYIVESLGRIYYMKN